MAKHTDLHLALQIHTGVENRLICIFHSSYSHLDKIGTTVRIMFIGILSLQLERNLKAIQVHAFHNVLELGLVYWLAELAGIPTICWVCTSEIHFGSFWTPLAWHTSIMFDAICIAQFLHHFSMIWCIRNGDEKIYRESVNEMQPPAVSVWHWVCCWHAFNTVILWECNTSSSDYRQTD